MWAIGGKGAGGGGGGNFPFPPSNLNAAMWSGHSFSVSSHFKSPVIRERERVCVCLCVCV